MTIAFVKFGKGVMPSWRVQASRDAMERGDDLCPARLSDGILMAREDGDEATPCVEGVVVDDVEVGGVGVVVHVALEENRETVLSHTVEAGAALGVAGVTVRGAMAMDNVMTAEKKVTIPSILALSSVIFGLSPTFSFA